MTKLVAFDPGGTTGFVIFDNVDYRARDYDLSAVGVIEWHDRKHIETILRSSMPDVIVIEDFKLRRDKALEQSGSDMPAPRVIERILVYCEQLKLDDRIVIQMPGLRTSCNVPLEHQRVCRISHIRAAYLHARYYVLTHKRLGQ